MAELYRWSCSQCGTEQAMPHDTNRVFRASSQTFYCVLGHPQHYPQGKSAAEKLQEQLEAERRLRQRAEQKIAEKEDQLRDAWATANDQHEKAKHERNRANGYKGHATRITKRAKAGVCPCCNRTFQQLARHMATQHPTFTPMPIEVAGSETVQ